MFPSPKNLMGLNQEAEIRCYCGACSEQHWRREPARMAAVKERAAGGRPNKPNVIPLETAHYTLSRPATTRRAAAASRVVAQAQPSTKIRMAARF